MKKTNADNVGGKQETGWKHIIEDEYDVFMKHNFEPRYEAFEYANASLETHQNENEENENFDFNDHCPNQETIDEFPRESKRNDTNLKSESIHQIDIRKQPIGWPERCIFAWNHPEIWSYYYSWAFSYNVQSQTELIQSSLQRNFNVLVHDSDMDMCF